MTEIEIIKEGLKNGRLVAQLDDVEEDCPTFDEWCNGAPDELYQGSPYHITTKLSVWVAACQIGFEETKEKRNEDEDI